MMRASLTTRPARLTDSFESEVHPSDKDTRKSHERVSLIENGGIVLGNGKNESRPGLNIERTPPIEKYADGTMMTRIARDHA